MDTTGDEADLASTRVLRSSMGHLLRDAAEPRLRPSPPARTERPAQARPADWSRALLMVEDAAEALREKDIEIAALNLQIELQKAVSQEEFQALQAHLALAQAEVQRAYDDASRANHRAADAEAWLKRLESTLRSAFGHRSDDAKLHRMG